MISKMERTINHSRPTLNREDLRAVSRVLRSGMIAEGDLVDEFQKAVSRYLGLPGGVATASGTAGIFLALLAMEVGPGDEVIIPTYVCRSVWDAVTATGARPVLCDLSDDWCADARTIGKRIGGRSRAVIVVHTFGIAVEMEPVIKLGLPVIEDCCQALGAEDHGRKVGTFGDLCVLSFHATKLLTTGEGGMVLARDPGLLNRLRRLGRGGPGRLELRQRQSLSDLQAALGLAQLERYGTFLRRRCAIANFYFRKLRDLSIGLPRSVHGKSIFFRFPIRARGEFEKLEKMFARDRLVVRRGVDHLIHRGLGMKPAAFPHSEKTFAETISLPLYPSLTRRDCERVADSCRRIFSGKT